MVFFQPSLSCFCVWLMDFWWVSAGKIHPSTTPRGRWFSMMKNDPPECEGIPSGDEGNAHSLRVFFVGGAGEVLHSTPRLFIFKQAKRLPKICFVSLNFLSFFPSINGDKNCNNTTTNTFYVTQLGKTGVIMFPNNVFKGNPPKLPYICCLLDPPQMGNLMIPARSVFLQKGFFSEWSRIGLITGLPKPIILVSTNWF